MNYIFMGALYSILDLSESSLEKPSYIYFCQDKPSSHFIYYLLFYNYLSETIPFYLIN